ncbi:MAG: hypothetical protein Q8O20_05135 [Sulfuricurvum sp.]|uniref:hypothetical protein n=1 Tax=Sulfuricurvum sp. TaxID=2025608 RepID=UPI00273492B8|nr:hypothetical protein [Sulfuricurvum sp.]MDP2850439.1 hypothetical protein [Sulfuricurvum sp.]
MNDKLELSCPKCNKENTVNLSTQLNCKQCGEILTEKKYIKKPFLSISTTKSIILGIILGGIVISFLYYTFKKDRYSTREEFTILTNCIMQNKKLFGRSSTDRQNICIDAYNQTLEDERDLGQKLYADKSQIFTKLFDQNVEKLSK